MKHIIIVGGGAGGLELATRLGRKLGRKGKAKITLIDQNTTHLWKPLLHEVAAGTLDANEDELSYRVHASRNHYTFQQGQLTAIDHDKHTIALGALYSEVGNEIVPERTYRYDKLVLAIGSITNDLNVKGVSENCLFLDQRFEADYFQQVFLKNILRLQNKLIDKLNIIIVGGGATGVELAAELNYMVAQMESYGFDHIDPRRDYKISLIEAAPRLLANLPERISNLVAKELTSRGITVLTGEQVQEVTSNEIITASGKHIHGTMIVWAAGVKVPELAKHLDELSLNRLNQIKVNSYLQTTVDPDIYAMGDCAEALSSHDQLPLPPRAQVASQQAMYLSQVFACMLIHKTIHPFRYRDYGSLISMSARNTLGSLMGRFTGSFLIEGRIARIVYLSLYKKHQAILHGYWRVFLLTLANRLTRKIKPHFKLH